MSIYIKSKLKSFKSFLNKRQFRIYYALVLISCLCILLISFQNCQTDVTDLGRTGSTTTTKATAPAPDSGSTTTMTVNALQPQPFVVTGLSDDRVPRSTKTWNWGCNRSSCTYRHTIN